MTAIGDLVELLLASGTSADVVRRAIDLAQLHAEQSSEQSSEHRRIIGGLSADSSAERRKAYDRERQAKIRRAQKNSEIALSSSSPPESQKPKEEKKERAKRDRGHVCPDDLHPSESHFEAGLKENISRVRVEACCEAMKSWSKSNSHRAVARKVDWNAALFGWIGREAERTKGKINGHRTIMAAADDLLERVKGFDAPAPSGLRDGTRAADARLLPKG